MSYHITKATEADILIKDLAEYEKESDAVVATPEMMKKSLFEHKYAETFLARELEEGSTSPGKAVGFAMYFFTYSTWLGQPGLYLEDLYVAPEHRSKGLGKTLFGYLGEEAKARGCLRVEWRVLKPSIDFYEKRLLAERLDEWHTMRIEGAAGIDKLCELKRA